MNSFDITALTAGLTLPAKYAVRTVRPTAVTPTLDGKITAEEWGDTPDFRLNAEITGGKRTYCLDHYGGAGLNIAGMDLYWRWDDAYVYTALRLTLPNPYRTPAKASVESVQHVLTLHLGEAYIRISFEGGEIRTALGNVNYALQEENGVLSFEFAASREAVTGGRQAFTGYAELADALVFRWNETGKTANSIVNTRTTPMYETEAFTHDVFVLEAGEPAPAKVLPKPEICLGDCRIGDVKLSERLTLRFSEPTVLEQGEVGDQIWGHYQFPSINRMSDGSLRAGWTYSRDTIEYKSEATPSGILHCVSRDEGKTWEYGGELNGCYSKNLMPNGKYFVGFAGKGAYKTDYLNKYTPAMTWGSFKMFFAEDIEETVDKVVTAYEYDPKTGEKTAFTCDIDWPYMPLVQFPGGLVYPTTQIFALSGGTVTTVDGEMYMPMYFYSFDAFAKSREEAVKPCSRYYALGFFKSSDCGRSWKLLSQIMAEGAVTDFSEGPCEPEMTVAPDGSFVMLFRTGGCNPCYIVRSTDRGATWSEPRRFDDIGVLPQVLTLPCGVTLASYGRPTMRFAATDDPSATVWEKPIDFPVCGGANQSCFYTDLFPVSDDTALFIYTDFMYPNENGVPVRSVLVRTVTAIRG